VGLFPEDPNVRFAQDSPLEGIGFELTVPLLRKALLGVPIRDGAWKVEPPTGRDGDDAWGALPIAVPFAVGPRVRIRLPPRSLGDRGTSPR
jgi:hypothetical protein